MGPQRSIVAGGEGGDVGEQTIAEVRGSIGVESGVGTRRYVAGCAIGSLPERLASRPMTITTTITAMTTVAGSILLALCPSFPSIFPGVLQSQRLGGLRSRAGAARAGRSGASRSSSPAIPTKVNSA